MMSLATRWECSPEEDSYSAILPGAIFKFTIKSGEHTLTDYCDVALRNNQNRRFLFVSPVIGRHLATSPSALRATASHLAIKLKGNIPDVPTLFFGMSETATTIGHAVFREWINLGGEGLYIESTRHRTGGKLAFEFSESHSHAAEHVVHLPGPQQDPMEVFKTGTQIVIVDDEATTGRTAYALVNAFKAWRIANNCPEFDANLAVILQWGTESSALEPFKFTANLIEGNVEIEITRDFPLAPQLQLHEESESNCREGVRLGSNTPELLPSHWKECISNLDDAQEVLVIGSGEYGFQPLLLAEYLESLGKKAWLQSVTRSPILCGGAITHTRSFPSITGCGYQEHLYNVNDSHTYDIVLLCTEGPKPPPNHPLWKIPRLQSLSWVITE